jgi:hypothetical protein
MTCQKIDNERIVAGLGGRQTEARQRLGVGFEDASRDGPARRPAGLQDRVDDDATPEPLPPPPRRQECHAGGSLPP